MIFILVKYEKFKVAIKISIMNSDKELYYKIALLKKDNGHYLEHFLNDKIEEIWLERNYDDIWGKLNIYNEMIGEVTINSFDKKHIEKTKKNIMNIDNGIVLVIGHKINDNVIVDIRSFVMEKNKNIDILFFEIPNEIKLLVEEINNSNKILAYERIKELEAEKELIIPKKDRINNIDRISKDNIINKNILSKRIYNNLTLIKAFREILPYYPIGYKFKNIKALSNLFLTYGAGKSDITLLVSIDLLQVKLHFSNSKYNYFEKLRDYRGNYLNIFEENVYFDNAGRNIAFNINDLGSLVDNCNNMVKTVESIYKYIIFEVMKSSFLV